ADGSALDASTSFRLGTSGGAELLRMPVGSIEPGRRADLVALDLHDLSLQPRAMLDRHVVFSMQPTAIERVMVGGEIVVARGRPTRIDLGELRAEIDGITSGWARP
ncbi:MAG: amidohydrolase family protein, partial [Actinomycetota bacterium]